MADALHHSCHLNEWYSPYQDDKVFGAKHNFFRQDLAGKISFINPPFNTFEGKQNLIEKVIEKISESLRSNLPTRVILLIPIFEGKVGHLYETQARKSRFMEIATFPKGLSRSWHLNTITFTTTFHLAFFLKKLDYICARTKRQYIGIQ